MISKTYRVGKVVRYNIDNDQEFSAFEQFFNTINLCDIENISYIQKDNCNWAIIVYQQEVKYINLKDYKDNIPVTDVAPEDFNSQNTNLFQEDNI